MFHPDGIEVYLKPAGDENDNIRLAELELSESQNGEGDERTRRCAVLARHGNLKVVVRPSRDFKMYSASALIIQINPDVTFNPNSMAETIWNRWIVQRSKAHEQFEKSEFWANDKGKEAKGSRRQKGTKGAITMSKAHAALCGDFDTSASWPMKPPVYLSPTGSIVVSVCRGHAQWIDDPKLKSFKGDRHYGPGDPTKFRRRKRDGNRPVDGEKGRWYTFEFQYRSEAYIRARHRSSISPSDQTSPQASPIGGNALLEDPYFLPLRKGDEVERQKARAAYERLQAALENGEDVESLAKTGKKDSSNASSGKSVGASKPNKPQFCNCADPSHNRGFKTPRASTGSRIRQARPRVPEVDSSISKEAPRSGASDTTKVVQPDDLIATVCAKCSGLKVPGFQRPAFLQKWYSENPQQSTEDVDDDEELPPPPAEQPKTPDVENPSEVEGADKAAAEGDANDTEPPASAPSGDEASPEEASEPAVVAEETTGAADSEELIAKPTNDAATDTPDAAAPIATGAAVFVAGHEEKAASAEGVAADNSDAPTEEHVDHSQATPNERSPLAGATPSRKRASEPPTDVRPPKQQRIDIDLTGDDEPTFIKREGPQEGTKSNPMVDQDNMDDREELQAQLQDIAMREEQLELRREKLAVERKLRELAKKEKRQPSQRITDFIKIED